jgi:hypothetical protein
MNTLELKNQIIRNIESLNEEDFEKVVHHLLEVLKLGNIYKLSVEENEAIDQALSVSEEGESYTHEDVVSEARNKFPNLKFK